MIGIVPAAGFGERMKSVTNGKSKEALPLGGVTILDRVLDELFACQVERVIVVSRREKSDIEEIVARRREPIELRFQAEPKGLMDAIASSGSEEDSLITLPDTIFETPFLNQFLIEAKQSDGAVCVQEVAESEVSKYGIAELVTGTNKARKFLEKPNRHETNSRLAIAARYFLSDRIIRYIQDKCQSESREEPLVEAFNDVIQRNMSLSVYPISRDCLRFDCGSPEGYAVAKNYFEQNLNLISKQDSQV